MGFHARRIHVRAQARFFLGGVFRVLGGCFRVLGCFRAVRLFISRDLFLVLFSIFLNGAATSSSSLAPSLSTRARSTRHTAWRSPSSRRRCRSRRRRSPRAASLCAVTDVALVTCGARVAHSCSRLSRSTTSCSSPRSSPRRTFGRARAAS